MGTMTQVRTHPSLATNITECSVVGREQEMGPAPVWKGLQRVLLSEKAVQINRRGLVWFYLKNTCK